MLFSDMTKLFKLKYVKRIDLFYIVVRDEVRDAEGLDPDFNLSEIKTLVKYIGRSWSGSILVYNV